MPHGVDEPEGERRVHVSSFGAGDVALFKDIAEAASDRAIAKALLIIGLDIAQPLEAQRQFSVLRLIAEAASDPEHVSDMLWIRKTRTRLDGIVGKMMLTAVGMGVVGAAGMFWTGFRAMYGLH